MNTSPAHRLALLSTIIFAVIAASLTLSVWAKRSAVEDKGVVPAAPSITTATLTDNIPAATKVAPGGTINYTATITTGGVSPADDATNVNYSGPLDANTTLVAGSVHASPIAFNDTYNWIGNTFLDSTARALPNVTANDIAVNAVGGSDTFTITAITNGSSALGGTVNLAVNGSFTYNPPLNMPTSAQGASVTDSFTYTISNNNDATLTSTGTVSIVLTGRVFYLQGGAAGDGRSGTPSGNPATMSTNADKSTDIFYIFSNATPLNGLFTVDAGQQLLGQGVNLVVTIPVLGATTLFTSAAPTPSTTNSAAASNCVTLAGAPGNNTLSGFNIGNCTGFAIQGANVGTITISTLSINTTGGGLDLTGVGSPTATISLTSLTSSAGTKNVNLVGLNGTIGLGSGALSGASGNAFDVSGAGNAVITYSGTITNTTARSVNVANKSGGSVSLSGLVIGSGTGVNLSNNAGATINFTGGINLTTTTNAAFTATGPGPAATSGGTVNVTDPNALGTAPDNTIVTTSGTPLTVTNTTIGASGLNFRSIAANGAANGIFLNNTGSSGGLNITGDGSNTTKGGNGTGGTIQNSTGADATTNGIAIYLNNTSGAQLRRITVSGTTQNNGVYAESVTNLTLQYCNIGGTIGTTSGSNDLNLECPVEFGKTSPSLANGFANGSNSTVDNCLISGGIQHNFEVYQTTNTATLTISNSNITSNGAALGSDGINIETTTTANLTVSVQTCLFDNNKSQALQASSLLNSTLDLTVNGCTIQKTTQGNEGFVIQNAANSHLTAHVTNNTFTGILGTNILVGQVALNASNLSSLVGVIKGNNITVGNATTFPTNRTLIVFFSSTNGSVAPANVLVDTNTINTFSDPVNGIAEPLFVSTPDANSDPSFTATVTNNVVNINDPAGTSVRGIAIQSTQNVSAGCIDVRGNDVNYSPAPPAGINGLRVRQVNPATLQLEQGVSAGTAATVLAANNPLSTTEVVGTVTVVGNSTCQTAPSAPSVASGNDIALNFGITGEMLYVGGFGHDLEADDSQRQRRNQVTDLRSELARVIYETTGAIGRLANRVDDLLSPTVYAEDKGVTPSAGETVMLNTITTLPAGRTLTIKYAATVNTPPLARQVSTRGTVSGSNFASVLTTDPGPPVVNGPTVTLIDTAITWTGATSTDWNVASNWQLAGPVVSTYAPGVSNPAVNDVTIPAAGVTNEPNISISDIGIFSLNLATGRTLTITSPRILTIGGGTASDLTLNGTITGGTLNLGTGTHAVSGTGSLSSTNLLQILSGSTATLSNNLQIGALTINAGGTFDITNRTLSLNGAALTGGGTFTTTGSTIIMNGSAAQTLAGFTYNNLTINNTIGTNITGVTLIGNATVNGALTLTSSDLDTGANTLTMPNTATSSGVSDVVGNVKRTGFALASPLSFGNPNNLITITAATLLPADINVNLAKSAPAGFSLAVQRTYTITPNGGTGVTATLRLHYLDSELNGNVETAALIFRRFNGSGWAPVTPTSSDFAANWLQRTGVTQFSPWTFSSAGSPTATNGSVTGRITDAQGAPVEGAVVRLSGTQNRKFITDANGFYRFDNVEASGFYVVTPSRANYTFTPAQRSFNLLGENTDAAFGATVASGSNYENPLDTPEYFVRQHYVDFLGREPDEAGFNFWSDQIIDCGLDQDCIASKRENVSAAYFLSIEFQNTGGLVDGLYRASYGAPPQFSQFMPDARTVAQGVIVGNPDWQAKLVANKQAFVEAFVNRAAFHAMYDNMDNSLFVDTLIGHTRVSFSAAQRDELVTGLAAGTLTRAGALQSIADNQQFRDAKFNQAFVLMEYFGYLRRDPDADGYAYWLNKLNQFKGNFEQAEMVKAFIVSSEYRQRFPR